MNNDFFFLVACPPAPASFVGIPWRLPKPAGCPMDPPGMTVTVVVGAGALALAPVEGVTPQPPRGEAVLMEGGVW